MSRVYQGFAVGRRVILFVSAAACKQGTFRPCLGREAKSSRSLSRGRVALWLSGSRGSGRQGKGQLPSLCQNFTGRILKC